MSQPKVSIIALLLVGFFAAGVVADERDAARLSRLDAHLSSIQAESRLGRYIGGGILVGGGALMAGTFGLLAMSSMNQDYYMIDPTPFLIAGAIAGGAMALPGGLILAIKPETETLPERFAAMAQTDSYAIAQKIAAGETYLESLATKGRDGRLIGGATSLIMGLAGLYMGGAFNGVLPANLRFNPYGEYSAAPDYSSGITLLISAIPTLLIKSRQEREYDSYKVWLEKEKF